MTDAPCESPDEAEPSPKPPAPLFSWQGAVMLGLLLLLALCLFLPAVRTAGEPARRNTCAANLKSVVPALHLYQSTHGSLPPAYTVDAAGNRLHSWRTLLLPYLEQRQLFDSIDFSKPWDDRANATAREKSVTAFECPSGPRDEGLTTYLGVVGPDTLFSATWRETADIEDRWERTVVVVDVHPDHAVHWMSPHDIGPEEVVGMLSRRDMQHPGMLMAGFLDGGVRPIELDISAEALRAMLTIAGDEPGAEHGQ